MAKKNALTNGKKNAAKVLVEKSLETLLVSLEAGIDKKTIKGKVKRAGKILLKGIKSEKTTKPASLKEAAPVV